MKEMDIVMINDLGISANETKVYMALIELGSAPVSDIALKSGIHRVNIYDSLKRLQERGLVGAVIRGEKSYFEPAPPSEIEKLIIEKERRLSLLKQNIPDLTNIFNKEKSKQAVHHYIGKNGLIAAYNKIIEATEENGKYIAIGSTGIMREILPVYTPQFIKKMGERGITARVLYYQSGRKIKKFKHMEVRYIPDAMKFIPMTIYIFDGFVTIINFEPLLAIEIQSDQIYNNYMKYAEWLWSIGEK